MIRLKNVVARLAEAGLPRVLGVLEYSALENAPPQLPALFVVPVNDEATPNRMAGIIDQRVTLNFQVIIVIQATAARVSRPSEDLDVLVELVRAELLGWMIPGAAMPTEYAGGRLLSAGGREAVWGSRFRTAYHLRSEAQ